MSDLNVTHTFSSGTTIASGQVNQNFTDIRSWANDGNISDDNFSASAGMYTAYRTILRAQGYVGRDSAAGTYPLQTSHTNEEMAASPVTVFAPTASQVRWVPSLYIDDADYTISGRTPKLRLRAQVSTNATQPTITFTVGLYPVTFAGGADSLTLTAGTVVSGSTVAIVSPAASSTTQGNSGDFSLPGDGQYCLAVVTSGQLTNNNASLIGAQLQLHWT